jgi:uncharacterized protein YerC
MKIKIGKLSDKQRVETLDALYTAASSVHGRSAVKLFLRDLLTPSERVMLGRRIMIARKLISGESYSDIIQELGVGADTVHKVQKWLSDQMPGYEHAIAGLEKELQNRRMVPRSAIDRLKKKYPLHFLLFPSTKPNNKPKK